MKITLEDYKKAILEEYELAKNGEKSHYLLDPTPASLKKLASEMCEHLSYQDAITFKIFFGFKSDTENKSKAILNFDTDKFRPLSKFLKGKSNLQEIQSANLLAVFVDLEIRPFLKFTQKQIEDKRNDEVPREFKNGEESKDVSTEIILQNETKVNLQNFDNTSKKSTFSKPIMLFCVGIFVALSAFSVHKAFEKKCMIWKDDHYEKIDCENSANNFAGYSTAMPIDNNLLKNFKRIKVSDTTTFFKNEKPVVWYLKRNNECEFFNAPGLHPINKKTLKEVTPHIIKAHVFNKY